MTTAETSENVSQEVCHT